VRLQRSSGILLHLTSLPGRFGVGDLGPESRYFADALADAKQRVWCVLPFGPPGPFNSPYQSCSAFAGSPLLISPDELVERGYLAKKDLRDAPGFPAGRVDYTTVTRYKNKVLRRAFLAFTETEESRDFAARNSWWLDTYTDFMALRHANRNKPWNKFDTRRRPSAQIARYHSFLQFEFFRQWAQLRKYCRAKNISILGDLPFYVEYNSADVWSHPELFDLDADDHMRTVGGVPPDYFSENGQRWGSSTYRWGRIAQENFRWWIDRFRFAFEHLDLLRVDHFRGFEAFWSVPADDKTARNGRWVEGPGAALFEAVKRELGDAAIVAENLGVISPEVEALRNQFGFPGLAVLQFGFSEDGTHLPTNYTQHTVAFTGTHDNNTTNGWWHELRRNAKRAGAVGERETLARVKSFLHSDAAQIHWLCTKAVMESRADLAVLPLQDVFGLGSDARMNFPGRQKGNWTWRFERRQLSPALLNRLRDVTESTGRAAPAQS
jgi:4-alpha-glucanotransferase